RGGVRQVSWAEVSGRTKVLFLAARILRVGKGKGRPPGPRLPGAWVQALEEEEVAQLLQESSLAGTRLRRVCLPEVAPELLVHLGGGDARDVQQLLKAVI